MFHFEARKLIILSLGNADKIIVHSQQILLSLFFAFSTVQAQTGAVTTWTPPAWSNTTATGTVDDTFTVPESLKNDVDFWIKIYSQYTTQQGVFHVSGDTEQILGDIDLTQVYANTKWSNIRKELEAKILTERQKRRLAIQYGINIKKIRLQMGLKDRMAEAIKLSGMYLPMMENIFREEKIPQELTRVVFVESSFNIQAQSRAGASGLWQIMPRVSKQFKYMSDAQDLRNHPYYATKLAAKILKQNYQILKSWPLAVTAYNCGVGGLNKVVKKYKSNDISYLVENAKAKRGFGFASKNYYVTFLAALNVESHANLYFPEPIYKYKELPVQYLKVTKKLPYTEFLALFDDDRAKLKLYNPHLKNKYLHPGKYLPVGVIANIPTKAKNRLGGVEDERFSF